MLGAAELTDDKEPDPKRKRSSKKSKKGTGKKAKRGRSREQDFTAGGQEGSWEQYGTEDGHYDQQQAWGPPPAGYQQYYQPQYPKPMGGYYGHGGYYGSAGPKKEKRPFSKLSLVSFFTGIASILIQLLVIVFLFGGLFVTAIVAVVGILLTYCCCWLPALGGPILGGIGLFTGLASLRQIKRSKNNYWGMPFAVTGLVTGAIGLVLGLGLMIIQILFLLLGIYIIYTV